MDKKKISFAIIAHNEADKIIRTIESILWADEIVVVNCGSNDNTEQILSDYKSVKIINIENNPNLDISKNISISSCTCDWIFSLDADEVVSDSLKVEIISILSKESQYSGYYIPRVNYFLGSPLKYSMNYPDYVLRLFMKGKGIFPAVHVHETLEVKGKIGYLKHPILHYSYQSISEYIKKLNFYTSFEANYQIKNKSKDIVLSKKEILRWYYWKYIPLKPFIRFLIKYFLQRGFLDGRWGFHYSVLSAYSDYLVNIKIKEIKNNENCNRL